MFIKTQNQFSDMIMFFLQPDGHGIIRRQVRYQDFFFLKKMWLDMIAPVPEGIIAKGFRRGFILQPLLDFPGKKQPVVVLPAQGSQLRTSLDWFYFFCHDPNFTI